MGPATLAETGRVHAIDFLRSAAEQGVEAECRAGRQDEIAAVQEQPGAAQLLHRPLERVALGEAIRLGVELTSQIVVADLGWVQGEDELQDRRFGLRLLDGRALDLGLVFHSA